jgi:hypothetical protein
MNKLRFQIFAGMVSTIVLRATPGRSVEPTTVPLNEPYSTSASQLQPIAELEQVTSVSQLSDVKPTDWAFQALQSLVERYGCIAGYPDRTYRGDRALTRYEFAAGLNACLDRINELIAAGTANLVNKSDLVALQKLQEQFTTELAQIKGKVTDLEGKVKVLEGKQFSTTTKLSGLAFFNVTGAGTSRDVKYEGIPGSPADGRFVGSRNLLGNPEVGTVKKANTTFGFLTWLTLNTSFTGKDSLVTQLAAGNGFSPYNVYASAGFFNAGGVPFTDQTAGTVPGRTDVVIRDLFYSFPLNDSIRLTVGPRVNWYRHFDFNRYTFFLNGTSSFDAIGQTQSNTIDRGSGAVVEWNISKKLRFAAAYLGENTEFLPAQFGYNTSSNSQFGLFGGTNTASAELSFSPTDAINIRVGYNHSRLQAYGGQVGGALGEPIPYGYLDGGPGFSLGGGNGGLKYASADALTVGFDWAITSKVGLFGRYGTAGITLNPVNGKVNTQSFQVGLGFPDLGKPGALGVLTFLMPMDITRGRRYFAAGGGDGGKQYQFEASYSYPVSDHVAIVPAFYAVFNANNFKDNPTVYVGNLRTQFSF